MDKLKIRFYSDFYKSHRASHRLRGDVTSAALAEQGYDSKILTDWNDVDSNTIVIFLKGTLVSTIQRAKDLGAKILYDLCDNKFKEKEDYATCCQLADLVSVNSVQMGVSTKHHTGRDYVIMPDPYERPILKPKFNPNSQLELLWFGNQSSFAFFPIVEVWQRLEQDIIDYRYSMISSKTDRVLSKMKKRQDKGSVTGINLDKINLEIWTWERQGQLLESCDIVLMPVQTENPRTDTKSANRLIDSLISGRFVITTPLHSYLDFEPFTWQGDYIEGIKWARSNPEKVLEMITAGQQYVEQNYSAGVLSKKFIEDILYAIKR